MTAGRVPDTGSRKARPDLDTAGPLLAVEDLTVTRRGRNLVDHVTWQVSSGEHWVIIGPNGCGKTTLLRAVTWWDWPTSGSLRLLGETLGRTDVRAVRADVGFVSAAMIGRLRASLSVEDAVVTAARGALEPWWHHYEDDERARARDLIDVVGLAGFGARPIGELSSGERSRVGIARCLMAEAPLMVLDEPAAGMDLPSREDLLERLDTIAADASGPATVLVTHHAEEIPASSTHALLMADGRVVAQGPIDSNLTEQHLASTFGLPIRLEQREGRRFAWVARRPPRR